MKYILWIVILILPACAPKGAKCCTMYDNRRGHNVTVCQGSPLSEFFHPYLHCE